MSNMNIYNILVLGWLMPLISSLITEIKNYVNSILYRTIHVAVDVASFKELKFLITNHAFNITSLEFCANNLCTNSKLSSFNTDIPYTIYKGKYYMKIDGVMCTVILTDKEITLSCFSWKSFKPIYNIINLAKKEYDRKYFDTITVYSHDSYDRWVMTKNIKVRSLSNIVLDENILDSIIVKIDNFKNNFDFYNKIGIPYKITLLFKGPPGTGKSSLSNILAGYYKKNLYVLDPMNEMFDKSIKNISANSILLIEDLDRAFTAIRNNKDGNEIVEWKPNFNMSKFLNLLDGINIKEGIIVIMTANSTDVFPEALLRSGRIDLELNIGYCTKKMLKQYINMFYEKRINKKIIEELANKLYTNNLALSKVQQYLLNYIDEPEKALKNIEKKYK